MGIFYEEVMYKPQNNYTSIITESDIREIVNENEELFCEMMNMQVDQINEILNESLLDDFKIKKEDLLDPQKLKATIERINKEVTKPSVKDTIIMTIALFIFSFLGVLPGFAVGLAGVIGKSLAVELIGICAMYIGGYIAVIPLRDDSRYKRLLKKLDKAEAKIKKYLDNPEKYKLSEKDIKGYKKQLESISANRKNIKDAIRKSKGNY